MKNIYMTGATGKIGTHLIQTGKVGGIFSRLENPEALSEEINKIIKNHRSREPLTFLHAGAITKVSVCEKNPILAYETNIVGTQNLINALVKHKERVRLLYFSTCHVFSGDKYFPYIERSTPEPVNVYGFTKLSAEGLVGTVRDFPRAVIRLGKVVFNSDIHGMLSLSPETTSPDFIHRNFIHVDDLTDKLFGIVNLDFSKFPKCGKWGKYEVLHVGSKLNMSIYQYTNYIRAQRGIPPVQPRSHEIPNLEPRPFRCAMSTRAMERLLR